MATHPHTIPTPELATGRRSFFGAAPALALALAAPAHAADSNPDAELLRLGAKMTVAGAHHDAILPTQSDEELDAAHAIASCLLEEIEDTPARTLDGLLVKAEALAWCRDGAECDPEAFHSWPHGNAATDARLAASIMRDLAAMQAGRSQA